MKITEINSHKNLERVIDALRQINCRLQIIGKLTSAQTEKLALAGIDYRAFHGLKHEALAQAYMECDIVLFPSTFEGFGLPLIEGFQAGRVVVTSDISPMNEIADGAACLVDPLNAESIRNGVLKVINDKPYREALVNKGFKVVKNYTPQKIARQYYQLYQQIYEEASTE